MTKTTFWGEHAGKMEMSNIENNLFRSVRVRKSKKCIVCHKVISKGDYCLGKFSFDRVCLKCAEKLFSNALSSLNKIKSSLERVKKAFYDNLDNYIKNNLANSL